jgi:tRNA pseudouridine32 synthase / 23S rRNA pseudouridine746 synthase
LLPANRDDYDHPLQLLARSIAFVDPITGQARKFDSARSLKFAQPGAMCKT